MSHILFSTLERNAKIIQTFYRTYIKVDRDPISKLPLDPISHEGIPKELQIRLFIHPHIQYFDLETLDSWLTVRKKPINPMTNLSFSDVQIISICKAYLKANKNMPSFLIDIYNEYNTVKPYTIIDLINFCGNIGYVEEIRNILYTNAKNIELDKFNLNTVIVNKTGLFDTNTALMNAVYNDNIVAVEELLYFNPDLNIADNKFGYKAIDIAIIGNGKNSMEIMKSLLFYGARLDIITKMGISIELTNDINKLEILYNFLD
jgi:hypothetical protein